MRLCAEIILLGAGGHAKVVMDALQSVGLEISGVVDPSLAGSADYWRDVPVLGNDQDVLKLSPDTVELVNGIGSLPGQVLRKQVFLRFASAGFRFRTVVHSSAVIGSGVKLMPGAQIMAGAIVQADSLIGANSIINTGARIDHDCIVGPDVHIAPGAVISGGVKIGVGTHVGTGASVIQRVVLGEHVLIGAGTVVVRDVRDNARITGSAPREISQQDMEPK